MKRLFKQLLKWSGVNISLTKNLGYLDPFVIIRKKVQKSNPVIFDLGACDGHTALIFKKLVPGSIVHSFEPYPDSFALLEKNAAQSKDIIPHCYALSNFIGKSTFYVNKSKATNSLLPPVKTNSFIDDHAVCENEIEVNCITLDQFVQENQIGQIDILKLDVQGGELKVFEGAKQLLQDQKIKLIYTEIWFMEAYANQPLYHDIASYLAQFGYKPFGIYHIHYRKDGQHLWGDAIFYID